MDVIEAIRKRKSIRGFKQDAVPQPLLEEIIKAGMEAPSAMNTQPWLVTVVTGPLLERIRDEVTQRVLAGEPISLDIPHGPYTGIFRERQKAMAADLFRLMDVPWEDRTKRAAWVLRGFRLYDAPVALLVAMDESVDEGQGTFAIGAFCQNICLAAWKHGLGTCIADQGVAYPAVIRAALPVPPSARFVMGIALGYPDPDFPANKLETAREPIENVVKWYSH